MIDTLLRIRVFIAAYEERSYTVAAKREHLTQSGVTHHIQQLQHYLGVKLFVRQLGNIMTPTPAADAYTWVVWRFCANIQKLALL